MLAKILALWIVALAASPFTQPFSTVRLDRLHDRPAQPVWKVNATDAASIADVISVAEPSNPPVEIRYAGRSERPLALIAPDQPGARESAVSAATQCGASESSSRTVDPFCALRL